MSDYDLLEVNWLLLPERRSRDSSPIYEVKRVRSTGACALSTIRFLHNSNLVVDGGCEAKAPYKRNGRRTEMGSRPLLFASISIPLTFTHLCLYLT
jgi:hypothetical protein